jgi:hypothetical protein
MRLLIRIAFALIFLCLAALNTFASGGSSAPKYILNFNTEHFRKFNKDFLNLLGNEIFARAVSPSAKRAAESHGHICSCQILDLKSRNYQYQHVVLLAEKTNNGSAGDFEQAKAHIAKEKKHLRKMFFDRITVISEQQGAGSCQEMYFKLKTSDSRLQLLEILNADTY